MLGPGRRLVIESLFLVMLAVAAGLAGLSSGEIIGLMALGWGLTALVELVSWNLAARRASERRAAPVAAAPGAEPPLGLADLVAQPVPAPADARAPRTWPSRSRARATTSPRFAPTRRFPQRTELDARISRRTSSPRSQRTEEPHEAADDEPAPADAAVAEAESDEQQEEDATPETLPEAVVAEVERDAEEPDADATGDDEEDGAHAEPEQAAARADAEERTPDPGEDTETTPAVSAEPARAGGGEGPAERQPTGESGGRRRWFRRRSEAEEAPPERPMPRHVRLIPRDTTEDADTDEHVFAPPEQRAGGA